MNRPLSAQQKKFCELYVSGRPAGRAYEEAGYKAKGAKADESASRALSRNAKVIEYVAELRAEVKSTAIMTATERMEWLSGAIQTPLGEVDSSSEYCAEETNTEDSHKIKKVDPLRAMDILNKMDGAYAPEKHEHQISSVKDIIAKARNENAS